MTTKELATELVELMDGDVTKIGGNVEKSVTTMIQTLETMDNLPMSAQQGCVAAVITGIVGEAILSRDDWHNVISGLLDDQTMVMIDRLIGLQLRLGLESDSEEDNG